MAMEIFLRIDGAAGSSKNALHKGWSEISSWQWGLNRVRKTGDNGVREVVNLNRITIVKPVGVESPLLMKFLAERKIIDTAEISVAAVTERRVVQKRTIGVTLKKVLIQSIETGASIDEDAYFETVVIAFGYVKYEYLHHTSAVMGGAAASSETQAFEWGGDSAAATGGPAQQ
ncbi:MAG: type VI secretion system tube protein Hcp [Gammaproteobacteria bacterium]